AFLKAMEFVALTRRVAEFSGIDATEIESDSKLSARTGTPAQPPRPSPVNRATDLPERKTQSASIPAGSKVELTPRALAAARAEAARQGEVCCGARERVCPP